MHYCFCFSHGSGLEQIYADSQIWRTRSLINEANLSNFWSQKVWSVALLPTRLVPERCNAPERTAGLMPAVSFLIICWCLVPSLLQERKSKQSKADVPRCKTTCWVCSEALLCGFTSGMELSSRFLTGHWTEPLIKSQSRPNWFSPPKTVCA